MALITTPGAPDQNSYCTVAEADQYNASRPFAASWAALTPEAKESALLYAALMLDANFVWTGAPTVVGVPLTADQALGWPRTGMLTRNGGPIGTMAIPTELKMAQAEYARVLSSSDLTATNDVALQGITNVSAGSVSVSFNAKDMAEYLALNSPQFAYMSKNVPDAVRLLLVPSWYLAPTAADLTSATKAPFVFEVHR